VGHWRRGDNGDKAVEFGRRGRGGTLKKAAQNVFDYRRRDLHLRGTFGLFLRDVIVAAGGHVVLKSCHPTTPVAVERRRIVLKYIII